MKGIKSMFGGGKRKGEASYSPPPNADGRRGNEYGRDSLATIYGTSEPVALGRGRSNSFDNNQSHTGGFGRFSTFNPESRPSVASDGTRYHDKAHLRSKTPPPGAMEGRRNGRGGGPGRKAIYVEDDEVRMRDDHGSVTLGRGQVAVEQSDGARVMMDDRGVEMYSTSGQRFHVASTGGDMRMQSDLLYMEKGGRGRSGSRPRSNRRRDDSRDYDSDEDRDRGRRRDGGRDRGRDRDFHQHGCNSRSACGCNSMTHSMSTCCHSHQHTVSAPCCANTTCGGGTYYQQHSCHSHMPQLPPPRTVTHSHSTTYVPVPVTPPHEKVQVIRTQVPGSVGYPGQLAPYQQQAIMSGQQMGMGIPQSSGNMAVVRQINGVPVVMPMQGGRQGALRG